VATQCIAAAQGAGASNRNDASQTQLINHCKAVAEQISALVQSVRASMANPDSPSAQLGLINSSQAMIPPAGKMVAAAKAAVPTVGDQAAALQLGNFAKATAIALAELRTASTKVLVYLWCTHTCSCSRGRSFIAVHYWLLARASRTYSHRGFLGTVFLLVF